MSIKYLKLGPKATSFYDMSTGLLITANEVIAVNEQYITQGKRTARALQGGHIAYATEAEYKEYQGTPGTDKSKDKTPQSLSERFFKLYKEENKTVKELSDSFNKSELISIAEVADIEVEDSDTKASIVEAIIEDIDSQED